MGADIIRLSMELIVISGPGCFEGEAGLINGLFEAGLEVFHLRKPGADIADCARLLEAVSGCYRGRIALHQHHELARVFGMGRLHFTEAHRRSAGPEVFAELSRDFVLSTSVHRMVDLMALRDFDYAFMGPVFDSFSKPDYRGCCSLQRDGGAKALQALALGGMKQLAFRGMKVIALGGIGPGTIGIAKKLGFDGAAMLGWVWNEPAKAIDHFKQVKCRIRENMY